MLLIAEAEEEIVLLALQGIRQLDVLQRPASEIVFQIVVTIVHPDADVLALLLPHQEREDVTAVARLAVSFYAAILRLAVPLQRGETADPRKHPRERIRAPPSHVEGADAAGALSRRTAAVAIAAQLVAPLDFGKHFAGDHLV